MVTGNKKTWLLQICLGAFLLLSGCAGDANDISMQEEPVLDIRGLADYSNSHEDFNQVLLRLQILHTNADILKRGLQTPEEHQKRLSYYLFGFRNDIALISGLDTIPCYDLHMERTYMDLPYMNFVLTFNHPINPGDELMIHDKVYTQQFIITSLEQNQDLR